MFESYTAFLIELTKPKNAALLENVSLLEARISVKDCFEKEPHLFQAFCDQCNVVLDEDAKNSFASFVLAYFELKAAGFFSAPEQQECIFSVNCEEQNSQTYIKADLPFTQKNNIVF